jgi:hypothetical protein
MAPENKSSAFWAYRRYKAQQTAQIVVGLTTGALSVLYSPQTSLNGAKLLVNKGPAKRPTIEDMSDAAAAPAIIIPGVTRDGEFTSGLPNKRKRDKDRQDPRKSRRPEMPVHGPGRGGRVGASATQHVVQNLVRDTTRDEDVRTILVSIFVSAFCVALGTRGVFVHRRSPGLIGCPSMGLSTSKRTGSKCPARGKECRRGWRRCTAQQGSATSQISGNRRGDATSERHAVAE